MNYIITDEELLKLMTVEISVNELIDLSRVIRSRPYNPQAEREKVLEKLYKNIHIRENEMNRKAGLEENLVTLSGYYTAAGALNWVRKMIEELRKQGEQEQP